MGAGAVGGGSGCKATGFFIGGGATVGRGEGFGAGVDALLALGVVESGLLDGVEEPAAA